jgi:signal transduction histidine kinase
LGLPVHLVPHHVQRASTRAMHMVALVCILIGIVVVIALQAAFPSRVLWPALIAFAIMGVVLWQLDLHRTPVYSVAFLLVGAACVFWINIVALSEFPGRATSDTFVLSMAKVVLIMVGGSGRTMLSTIAWATGGLVAAGVATAVAVRQTEAIFVVDGTAVVAFLLLVALQVGLEFTRFRGRSAQPSLHRAARDEQISAMRSRIEVKAAAVMHDTVLNHLAAIASAPDGALAPSLRTQINRDLEVLVGEEWLLDSDSTPDERAQLDWRGSRLFRAVEESRQLGLEVEVSGDMAAISRLDGERASAVALAAKQCLVNVLKHAGTDRAELVVYGSAHEVSVMVIDSGRGFSEGETGSDRLGLRQSVRRRIEAVDGTVQLWSTPGKGTSVMIRVPVGEAEEPV